MTLHAFPDMLPLRCNRLATILRNVPTYMLVGARHCGQHSVRGSINNVDN